MEVECARALTPTKRGESRQSPLAEFKFTLLALRPALPLLQPVRLGWGRLPLPPRGCASPARRVRNVLNHRNTKPAEEHFFVRFLKYPST